MTETAATTRPWRVIYMGTPDFAVPALEALIAADSVEVVGVVTNPDRQSGRGKKSTPPPVKVCAEAHGIEVFQPLNFRKKESRLKLEAWQPDLLVVAAYGQILPQRILDVAPHGALNIHASLLPRYRGAAPINWCIVRGESESGVTIMQMEAGLDSGPMLLKGTTPITPDDTAQTLHDRLSPMGAALVVEAIEGLRAGTITPEVQDHEAATWAPMMAKKDGAIDWSLSARQVADHIRGFNPWPGAFAFHHREEDGQECVLKVHMAHATERPEDAPADAVPGEVLCAEPSCDALVIACGEGAVRLTSVQAPCKRAMCARDFLNGYPLTVGDRLS